MTAARRESEGREGVAHNMNQGHHQHHFHHLRLPLRKFVSMVIIVTIKCRNIMAAVLATVADEKQQHHHLRITALVEVVVVGFNTMINFIGRKGM